MEDTQLFPSQSISEKEVDIEPFNSRKIERNTGVGENKRTWETKMECLCLCVREKRHAGERQ